MRSDSNKEFAFFIPNKFEYAYNKETGPHLAFYWLNSTQLVTSTKSFYPLFSSNDQYLIEIGGMLIRNNRKGMDYASLFKNYWSGI